MAIEFLQSESIKSPLRPTKTKWPSIRCQRGLTDSTGQMHVIRLKCMGYSQEVLHFRFLSLDHLLWVQNVCCLDTMCALKAFSKFSSNFDHQSARLLKLFQQWQNWHTSKIILVPIQKMLWQELLALSIYSNLSMPHA